MRFLRIPIFNPALAMTLLLLFSHEVIPVFYLERKFTPEINLQDNIVRETPIKIFRVLYECYNFKYNDEDCHESYVISCLSVMTPKKEQRIYATASFFSVPVPLLASRTMLLIDGESYVTPDELPSSLSVGVIPQAPGPPDAPGMLDFPLFQPLGTTASHDQFVALLRPLVAVGIKGAALTDLAVIFNTATLSLDPTARLRWNWDLPGYVRGLRKFMAAMEESEFKEQGLLTRENWERLGRMFLNKLMDPCGTLPVADTVAIPNFVAICKIYCRYLRLANNFFQLDSALCSRLIKDLGECRDGRCTCFVGTRRLFPIKMLYCDNEFRLKVDRPKLARIPQGQ